MTNPKAIITGLVLILIFVIATLATWVYSRVDSALPKLEGRAMLFGLNQTVEVNRDGYGIPTIIAKNREDAAMALGFVHAQERFFQMDLLRKNAAGELSSLFGEMALDYDKKIRLHRFRDRARTIVRSLDSSQLPLIKAYTRGVNHGLEYLGVPPFEYLLLQQEPVQWSEEDTILSVFSMYLDLQYDDGAREISLDIINRHFPKDIYAFINPKGSQWDAAIDGSTFQPPSMPRSDWPIELKQKTKVVNLAATTSNQYSSISNKNPDNFYGSNNWAVSSSISKTGAAIVANDMHLGIRVPNTWYRASIEYTAQGKQVKVTGATLPGTPNIVIGSNSNIAWGFTNSNGDWSDVIKLKTNKDGSQYSTPQGYKPFELHKQVIAIKDKDSIEIEIKETIWGPVIGESADGHPLAYRWVAHDVNAVNLAHTKIEQAQSVDEAFAIAAISGIPAQNMMVADKHGDIGWTIMGPIPRKQGDVGELPADWSTGENAWLGYLTADEYPRVKSPESNRLWTANSRIVGGSNLDKIGNGGYALGARAQQIRDRLFEKEQFSEQDLLAIALDTDARFLSRWQQFILDEVINHNNAKQNTLWQEAHTILTSQPLAATENSVAYRIVKNFREKVQVAIYTPMNDFLKAQDELFDIGTIRRQFEIPMWQLVAEKPDNFLNDDQQWAALFHQALEETLMEMTQDQPLANATWGQQNQTRIKHPLSDAIPLLGQLLNMPVEHLAGDNYMPRVDGGSFGASERMIVSPGHEGSGIFHMPTSQAGHPWSPYFGKGHSDWVEGVASPFLPGETKYKLTLLSY